MKLVLCKFLLGRIYHVSYSDFTLRMFFFSWPLLATGLNLSMLAIIGTPAFIWEIYCSSSGERPVRSPWQLIKYSESFTHPHSSSCSDLNVSLILTNLGLWTGQISAFQSTSSWINNFSSLYLLFCRQAVEEADSDPGSPGRREAMSVPDGAMEALPGEALLQLEIQHMVWVQVWGQLLSILTVCYKTASILSWGAVLTSTFKMTMCGHNWYSQCIILSLFISVSPGLICVLQGCVCLHFCVIVF